MIKELSDKLIRFGFTDYEAKAYCVLITQELVTATELSKLSEIPQGRIYSILNGLQEKGFCNVFPGSVKKFRAVEPKAAFTELIERQKQSVLELENLEDEMTKVFENKVSNSSPLDYIQILTSKQSQVQKFEDLILRTSSKLYSFNKKPYATGFNRKPEEIHKDSQKLIQCINSGVSVRAIFEEEIENIKPFVQMLEYYESIGEEVRVHQKLPLKMLLSDNEIAMVSMRNNDVSRFKLTSLVVEHTDLTHAFDNLFDFYWDQSITLSTFKEKYNV